MANHTSIPEMQVARAKHAFRDYVVWAYATPGASFTTRLSQQYYQARQHKLDPEGKAYFSVLVNEFHGPSVSGREDAR